jgi:integrase
VASVVRSACHSIALVFQKFGEPGTVRQTLSWFLEHGLQLPARSVSGEITWRRLVDTDPEAGEVIRSKTTWPRPQLLEQRDTAKKAAEKETGAIIPWVFFRLVAQGRGGPKQARPVKSFGKAWKRACALAGFPDRIPHDLRRSAIRTFVRKGISENTAMALSGHKTSSVFRRYDIISTADLDEAAAKLDADIAKPAQTEKPTTRVRAFRQRSS